MSLHDLPLKSVQTILVPDTLKQGTAAVEQIHNLVASTPKAARYVLDMKEVRFIEPCGVIALLSVIRSLSHSTGKRVLIKNLDEQIYPYLHRMNLFQVAEAWLQPIELMSTEWSRNAHTVNLLELTAITQPEDVLDVAERARSIFAPWLSGDDTYNLVRVVSELCQNIYQHSGDPHGCVLIQKYTSETLNRISLCLSVGDSGCGIAANLAKRFRWLGDEPLDFIRAAMDGYTSRHTGRGGLGLQTVRKIAASYGGYVTVRSETASVIDRGRQGGVQNTNNLTYVAGTQVSVKMYAEVSH